MTIDTTKAIFEIIKTLEENLKVEDREDYCNHIAPRFEEALKSLAQLKKDKKERVWEYKKSKLIV